ncbi:MAG: hypothetical protein IKO36_00880 [Bacteroidaceae bacterium]|nr:hypothetical protein [Bacteroidaceae bacterium]
MKKYKLSKTAKLYHISINKQDNKIFVPRVPSNRMHLENDTIPRVCVSTSIRGCIKSIGLDCTHCKVFIYTPVSCNGKNISDYIYKPTIKEVGDVIGTREKWITCPVRMKCIGYAIVKTYTNLCGFIDFKVITHWYK